MDTRQQVVAAAASPTAGRSDARYILGAERRPKPSRLPQALKFPLVVVLSLAWTAVGYSAIAQWTGSDNLGAFARVMSIRETALLIVWRVAELALAWFGDFDSYDLAALSLLSYGPTLSLFSAFYGIRQWTAAASLAVDVLSSVVPFALLRPLSAAHTAAVPNEILLTDGPIKTYTTLFASAIYAVALTLFYTLWLRNSFLLNFEGIPSIEPASSLGASIFGVTLALLFGFAARVFVFEPAAATSPIPEDEMAKFDPASATLTETFLHNVWWFRTQTKVAIRRTLVMAAVSGMRTFLQCAITIKGIEAIGATIYSSAWALASLFAGLALGLLVE